MCHNSKRSYNSFKIHEAKCLAFLPPLLQYSISESSSCKSIQANILKRTICKVCRLFLHFYVKKKTIKVWKILPQICKTSKNIYETSKNRMKRANGVHSINYVCCILHVYAQHVSLQLTTTSLECVLTLSQKLYQS